MEERRHSDVQLEQRGAAARRPAILVATALVGAVACAFLAESQLQGAGRRDELMVLGPFGIGGKMPWVLSGGTEALLKQLTWDHATSHPEARAPSRGRSAWPARAQQLAMDGDNPALGKVVWRKHEPEASPFDDLEVERHVWKGAGAPEENVMDDGEGTYVPDNPKTSEVTFRKQEPEKNLYDDQDEDSTVHTWKGPGVEKGLYEDEDDSPHVWRKEMPEEENVMADADDSKHVWKGPGPPEENVMADADDSTHVWRKEMPEEENVMADADDSKHEWKGPGAAEENVFDDGKGSGFAPDNPKASQIKFHAQGEEENAFADLPSDQYIWRDGVGGPEHNVFEEEDEHDAAKKGKAAQALKAKKASEAAQVHEEVEREVAALRRRDAAREETRLVRTKTQAAGQLARKKAQLAVRKREVMLADAKLQRKEDILDSKKAQLSAVKARLAQSQHRIARLEKEEKIHVWKQQHSPINVIGDLYPTVHKWKWHKVHEVLPSVWANLKTDPVKWHKYKAPERDFLNLPVVKPVWHANKPESNVLNALPTVSHVWHAQRPTANVLNSLPDGSHHWGAFQGEDNVLSGMPSDAHKWEPQTPE
ncbi:hypothetical protein T484DRAFT_1917032 [Baffinella frigidus]|nr:hypothetical protein T484DRAFT_1917032 [Cryptophyta sp. CCMP2293]